jgi:hypothetical protein
MKKVKLVSIEGKNRTNERKIKIKCLKLSQNTRFNNSSEHCKLQGSIF